MDLYIYVCRILRGKNVIHLLVAICCTLDGSQAARGGAPVGGPRLPDGGGPLPSPGGGGPPPPIATAAGIEVGSTARLINPMKPADISYPSERISTNGLWDVELPCFWITPSTKNTSR